MDVIGEPLPGVSHFSLQRFHDDRGSFVKTYARSAFRYLGIDSDWHEEFYSISRLNVVRGMHFQLPPHELSKMVYCAAGAVLDVLVDLRRGEGFGKVACVKLDAEKPSALMIPKGIAHGFLSLSSETLMVYKTSREHAPAHDVGIRWDSIDFSWGVANPVLSDRDSKHPRLCDFISPF